MKLPLESEAQRIGQRAEKCFAANRPDSWRVHSLEGTDDAGLDYQIQIVDNNRYSGIFRVQLKGTESPSKNTAGEYYSLSLERSTLNYYAKVTEPILLVLCDLSVDLRVTKDCPCFYVWIHDELKRHRDAGKDSSDSDTLVVRVPVANRLTEDLDLLPILETKLRLHKAAAALDAMVEEKLPSTAPDERSVLLENLAAGFSGYDKALLGAVAAPVTSPWPAAPKDSFAGKLNEVDRLLNSGAVQKAQSILDSLASELDAATLHEQAEYNYCSGRVAAWSGEHLKAAEYYEVACDLTDNLARYVVAWGEAQLAIHYRADASNDFSAIRARLTSSEPEVQVMLARVLAAEGDADAAMHILSRQERTRALPTLGILASMQGRHDDLVSLCDEGLAQPDIPARHKQLFYLLRAGAKFALAMPDDVRSAGDYVIAAWSGPASLNASLLRSAWNDIIQAADQMREAGWPPNVEFIADIWGATALMLGRAEETFQLAKEAADARPHIEPLQRTLELLAVNVEDYDTALAANERQPASAEQMFRKIGILHQAKAHSTCLEAVESGLDTLPQDHQLYPASIALGVLSADRLFFASRADALAARLQSRAEWEEHWAVLKFFRAAGQNVLAKDNAVKELLDDFHRLNRPKAIAFQLFHVLDASKPEQAADCVKVAERIREFQQLGLDGEFRLAQAYVTLADWSALLSVADRAISKYDHVGRFYAIRALALDKLGAAPDALAELRRLVSTSVEDRLATDTYVNIVMRSGFIDEALALAERLNAEETDPNRRIDCLQLLFNLLQAKEPGSKRAIDVAWAMGQLVDRKDESAEGQFLGTFLTSTGGSDEPGDPSKVAEFQQRLSDFFERWPNSRILRRGFLPQNSSGEELLKALKSILGDPQVPSADMLKLERQLSRGEMPVPFSWRPRLILRNVLDVGQLWEIGKRSSLEAHQYHLSMVIGDWVQRPFAEKTLGIPLLDLTALFVIQDLGLFDVLFQVFPKIAVSQALLMEIQERASLLSNSWAQGRYASLVQELNRRFEQIQQPMSSLPAGETGPKAHLLSQDMSLLLKDQRYFIYSDDAALRLFALGVPDLSAGFCTLDLLARADELGLLTAKQVGEKIGLLCAWKVSVVITARYLLASLPDEVGSARSVGEAVDAIRASETSSAMFEGIWNVRKEYSAIATHVAQLLAALVADGRNNIRTIAAIIGIWHGKAKLRTEITQLNSVERLAMLIAQTASHDAVQISGDMVKRLWDVYIQVVELEFGSRMDEGRERDAIDTMGVSCARLDKVRPQEGSITAHRDAMRLGLREATADMDRFNAAYDRGVAAFRE
ncbi:DUF4365 domain-containing protein [Paraburkholderia atlantica]|uniref:DUF4365 domain-containing protein n=1 Tax=Paraburkholderia atlantica TaxID=2654982 RepID=UPI00160F994D|nr:DUF4365 domain-containing protein [Paraburkholderia atlantica]MBB5417073.1 tetratricopeptide (TPR) repeat protein [Paraburkholderia atlantica]